MSKKWRGTNREAIKFSADVFFRSELIECSGAGLIFFASLLARGCDEVEYLSAWILQGKIV